MSRYLPAGELLIRDMGPSAVLDRVRTRLDEHLDGRRRLQRVERGRLIGRITRGRFVLIPRVPSFVQAAALVFRGAVEGTPEGTVIRFSTGFERFTLLLWTAWLGIIGASAVLSVAYPDPVASQRLWLLSGVVVVVAFLLHRSFVRSRQTVERIRAEVVEWFDDAKTEVHVR